MAADGTLTVTTPSGVTRTGHPDRVRRAATAGRAARDPGPPDLPLTGPRVIAGRPDRPTGAAPPDPGEGDPPPF